MADHLNDPIIRTKLYRPPVAPDFMSRERVLRKLEQGISFPLTLVSAPAGYGKSSQISHWLENCGLPNAWLSLDEAQGGLRNFLQYFSASLETISPTIGRETRALLGATDLPPVATLAGAVANELDLADERIVLVLDDFQTIKNPEVHEFVDCLILKLSPSLHLVIISRWDPPLSLAGLRGKNLITELRLQDLQFTREDTVAFLEKKVGRRLSPESLRLLAERTEGWPVALRLFTLAAQNREDPDALVRSDGGESRHLHEYLVAEILSGQSQESRNCLCRTSILDRFCAPLCQMLCDAHCGTSQCLFHDGHFEQPFQNVGLLCIPLDEKGEWFRFHHLFQELLQEQLKRDFAPDTVLELHKRSARWYEQRGWLEEALQHFLKAGDPLEAGRLVARHKSEILNGEQWNRLEQWLSWLPPEVVNEDPELLVISAWLMENRCRYADCFDLIDRADSLLDAAPTDSPSTEHLKGSVNILRSFQAYSDGNGKLAIERASRALGQVPSGCFAERGEAMIYLTAAHQMTGDLQRAHEVVNKELAAHSLHPEGTTYQSRLLASLCFVDWMDADLSLLERSARQIVELGDRMDLPESSAAGRYFIGIARYHLNDLSEAESLFSFVVSRRHAANLEISAQSTFALASVHQANGESDKANELVSSFCREMLRIRNMAVLSLATAFQADLALRQGHLARALKWARSFDPEPFEPMYRFQAPQMTLARILVFQEVSDESDHGAAQFLRRLEEYLRRTHNQRFLIEVKALQAILLASRGNEADALSSMGESVSLAQPGGFIRVFVDLGPGISSLLERLDADEEQSRYIERILAAFTESSYNRSMAVAPVRTAGPPGPELVEPLTNREIDILNLLGERLTNNEIADRLNISPATVKRHAENLYGKLGVSSRREAVHQAKHLGILVP